MHDDKLCDVQLCLCVYSKKLSDETIMSKVPLESATNEQFLPGNLFTL